jgi:hypothetical protein
MKKSNLVYQFKITLKEIEPLIWRRILVPSKYTFWDLHVAIQDAMGWLDSHLHQFRIKKLRSGKVLLIGIPLEDMYDDEEDVLAGWELDMADFFLEPGKIAEYEYDFGDSWEHEILLEGILLKDKTVKYPRCLGGERTCPPEDCGGTWGYQNLLEIMHTPAHEEYQSTKEWLGGKFDPEAFEPGKVRFDNPKKRWQYAFSK